MIVLKLHKCLIRCSVSCLGLVWIVRKWRLEEARRDEANSWHARASWFCRPKQVRCLNLARSAFSLLLAFFIFHLLRINNLVSISPIALWHSLCVCSAPSCLIFQRKSDDFEAGTVWPGKAAGNGNWDANCGHCRQQNQGIGLKVAFQWIIYDKHSKHITGTAEKTEWSFWTYLGTKSWSQKLFSLFYTSFQFVRPRPNLRKSFSNCRKTILKKCHCSTLTTERRVNWRIEMCRRFWSPLFFCASCQQLRPSILSHLSNFCANGILCATCR